MKKLLVLMTFLCGPSTYSSPALTNLSVDNLLTVFQVNTDLTYTMTSTETDSYYTDKAVQENKYATQEFDPKTQTLEVLDAYVETHNGQIIKVPKTSIYTRPSPVTQIAPQFTNRQVMSIVFPQIVPGSKTYVKWRLTQKTPNPFGFNIMNRLPYDIAVKKVVIKIITPASISIQYMSRGPVKIDKQLGDKEKTLTATVINQKPQLSETDMANPSYFETFFAATSLNTWSQYGNIWNQLLKDKIVVTDQIKKLAAHLTKGQNIEDSKATLYNFVVQKINSLSVPIHALSYDSIPTAQQVLETGYADPRGKAILLTALYKAVNINNQIAVTSSGSDTQFPHPILSAMDNMIIYLNDTAQYADSSSTYESFGVIPNGTSDQLSVLLSDNSMQNKTPAENPTANRYENWSQLLLMPTGSYQGKDELFFFGNLNGTAREILDDSINPEVKYNAMLAETDTGGAGKITYNNPKDLNTNVVIKGQWISPEVIKMGPSALFLLPEGYDNFPASQFRSAIPEPNRSFPFELGAKTLSWETDLQVPPNYQITQAPVPVSINNVIGSYQSQYHIKGNRLKAKRLLLFKQKIYPPKDYPQLQQLIETMLQDVQSVIRITSHEK